MGENLSIWWRLVARLVGQGPLRPGLSSFRGHLELKAAPRDQLVVLDGTSKAQGFARGSGMPGNTHAFPEEGLLTSAAVEPGYSDGG